MNNLVSVIIPIYNKEEVLSRCIESVLKQTWKQFELILVNDGSTDHSAEVCCNYLSDKRVIYMKKQNGGVSSARNVGLNAAQGTYITFVDADDEIAANFLETLMEAALNNELVVCGRKNHYWNGTDEECAFKENKINELKQLEESFIELFHNDFFSASFAKLYRKDRIKVMFDETLSYGEDLIFVLTYLRGIQHIRLIEDCLYIYHIQKISLTTKLHENELSIIERLNQELIEFYNDKIGGNHQSIINQFSCNSLVMLIQKMFLNKQGVMEQLKMIFENSWVNDMINETEVPSIEWRVVKTKNIYLIKTFFLAKLRVKKWLGKI